MPEKKLTMLLTFQTDVAQAKKEVAALAADLRKVASTPIVSSSNIDLNALKQGKQAAFELLQYLQKSVNIDTGKLNLATLSSSLKANGKTLEDYKNSLEACGTAGREAFQKVAISIATAENPTRRANKLMESFLKTLKNTAKWQISSQILHKFVQSMELAYHYSRDLNKSLTDIRIVTGQSSEQMEQFAIRANKAAKALKAASTLAYTDAALIYYQQGLSDEEVERRTNTTIKMMNVTGDKAEEVSSYMTAIWNNFAKGSEEELERYADVITALGAATAASSEEISVGLQKFAAIAETTGLSYDYAASALATNVSQTRQSADIVGTAYKAIFARIQDLELGKTLEDGTTLGKYSEALYKIGVNIKDANGDIKTMDSILDELGEKWKNLSKDIQIATAQVVGGTRQYAQLIALMDNWDMFQKNLSVARTSEGSLQEQADIYAKSWEAANNRVETSMQKVYKQVIDDKELIKITNSVSDAVEGTGGLIEGLGGVKGLLLTIGSIFMTQYAKEVPRFLDRIKEELFLITGTANKIGQNLQNDTRNLIKDDKEGIEKEYDFLIQPYSAQETARLETLQQVSERQQELNEKRAIYSRNEIRQAEEIIAQLQKTGEEVQNLSRNYDALKERALEAYRAANPQEGAYAQEDIDALTDGSSEAGKLKALVPILKNLQNSIEEINMLSESGQKQVMRYGELLTKIMSMIRSLPDGAINDIKEKTKEIFERKYSDPYDNMVDYVNMLKERITTLSEGINGTIEGLDRQTQSILNNAPEGDETLEQLRVFFEEMGAEGARAATSLAGFRVNAESLPKPLMETSVVLTQVTSSFMSFSAALDSIKNISTVFSDEDSTAIEKIGAVIGLITTALMTYSSVQQFATRMLEADTASQKTSIVVKKMRAFIDALLDKENKKGIIGALKATFGNTAQTASEKALSAAKMKTAFATMFANSTMVASLVTLGALVAVYAALIAVIVGVTAVVKAISDAHNKDAIAAQNAAEAASNLKEQYNETREAYENLKTTITDYKDAQNAIQKLTKNTIEWREAIAAANEKALELIESTDGLNYNINSDGLIEFTDGEQALTDARIKAERETRQAQSASLLASQAAKEAQQKANQTQARREYRKDNQAGDADIVLSSLAYGAVGGAALGLPGAIMGAIVGGVGKGFEAISTSENFDAMVSALVQSEDFKASGGNIADKNITDILEDKGLKIDVNDKELLTSIKELAKEINSNTESRKNTNELSVDLILQDNKKVQQSDYKDDIAAFVGDSYKKIYDQEKAKAASRGWLFNNGTDEAEAAMRNYAAYKKLNELSGYKVTNYRGDGSVEYQYIDENGDKQKKTVTADEIASVNASISDTIQTEANAMVDTLADINKATEQKLLAYKKGDISQLSINDLNTNATLSDDSGDLLNFNQMWDLGYNASGSGVEGFEKVLDEQSQAAKDALIEAAERFGKDSIVNNTIQDIVGGTNEAFGALTQESIQNYTATLGHIMYAGGNDAAESFNEGLEGLLNEYPDKVQEIMEAANSVDWSAVDSIDQFNSGLAKVGIHIRQNDEAWQKMLEGISKIQLKIEPRDYQTVRNQFIELKSLAEKIEIGSIISDEEYEKLIAVDESLKRLFSRTLEGYAYIGTKDLAETLTTKFQDDTREAMLQSIEMYNDTQKTVGLNLNQNTQLSSKDGYVDWGKVAAAARNELPTLDGETTPINAFYDFVKSFAAIDNLDSYLAVGGNIITNEQLQEIVNRQSKQEYNEEDQKILSQLFDNIAQAQSKWSLDNIKESAYEGLFQLGASFTSFIEGINAMRAMGAEYVEGGIFSQEDMNNALYETTISVANSAIMASESLADLDNTMNQIAAAGVNQSYDVYAAALSKMAEKFDNCNSEALAFEKALKSNSLTALKAAEDQLRAVILIGQASKEYSLTAETVEEQTKALHAMYEAEGMNAEMAAQLAISNARMNKGVGALSEKLEEWTETLKNATKGSGDYAEVASEIESALKDLLGLTNDFELPSDFLDAPQNLKLLKQAADGSQLAINELGISLQRGSMNFDNWNQALIDSWNATARTDNAISAFTMDMSTAFETADKGMRAIQDNIVALTDGSMTLSEALSGVNLNEESWIQSLDQMAVATGMTVEEMQSMLNSMGVQANVQMDQVQMETKSPVYTEYVDFDSDGQGDAEAQYKDGIMTRPPGWAIKHYTVAEEPVSVMGSVPVPHISINDSDVAKNKITSKTISFNGVGGGKKGGGISHSKTSSKKSSSKSKAKERKSYEKETERYHEITELIEDYADALEDATEAKDRAFGPAKLKAMQAEIEAQAQLNAGTEEYIREIEEWLAIDKERIQAQGAIFDEYGNIINYTELMQQHIDAYNAAVDAYNNSAQNDEDQERFEAAEKSYQNFVEQITQYEETNNLLQEQQDAMLEGLQEIYDLTTQRNQYIIEFKIENDDDALEFIDYLRNKLENFTDGVNGAAEQLAYLNEQAGKLMDKNSTYNSAIDMTLSHYLKDQKQMNESEIEAFIERFKENALTEGDMSILDSMTEEEFNYLREMRDNLLEVNNALIDNMNAVVETVQTKFIQTAEDLSKATRPIERAASALENYVSIIEIIGRDVLGITDVIAAELDNAAVQVAHSATTTAKTELEALEEQREEVQRLYDEAMAQGLTEMAYKWKIVLEEMDEEILNATDEFNSKWQEELTKAREAFERTVERIKQSMLDAFAGSIGSWSALKDSLEYSEKAADRFVPQYKEIYELSKLNRDIMKSIDNTSNIKNKQVLRDLQEEINQLEQQGGKISQYDLDNARRRYELELARLSLEEAREAKSTVRLSKDAEGNWSYIYTANQEEVENAEQEYEDKLYAMQEANNEYINSLSNSILELEEEYAEKLAEIRLDNTMSEEERNAAIERLNAFFSEQMEYLTNEGQKVVDNNLSLFDQEWTAYHNWTDAFGNDVQARIDRQHDFMTQFGDTILGKYTKYGNFRELNAKMVEIASNASAEMEAAYSLLQEQIHEAMEVAGFDVKEFGKTISNTVKNDIIPSTQRAENSISDMVDTAVDEFKELADSVSTWQITYATKINEIIKSNESLATSVGTIANAYAALVEQMYSAANAPTPSTPHFGTSDSDAYADTSGNGSTSGEGLGSDQDTWGNPGPWCSDDRKHWRIIMCISGPSKGQEKRVYEGKHTWVIKSKGNRYIETECRYCGHEGPILDQWKDNFSIDNGGQPGDEIHFSSEQFPQYFKSGGYTGKWNSSEGKLAILHEKELVLNKEDTRNILASVEMVRKLSAAIDLNAKSVGFALNYHAVTPQQKPIKEKLEVDQTVSIKAEFPNVQNRTEIEEAFTTLINQASQYANRKS